MVEVEHPGPAADVRLVPLPPDSTTPTRRPGWCSWPATGCSFFRSPRRTYLRRACAATSAPLNNFEPPATGDEVTAAALQYVRKVSGTTKPSQANQEAFDRAVAEIAHITQHLLDDLVTTAPPQGPRGRGRQGARPGRRCATPLSDAARRPRRRRRRRVHRPPRCSTCWPTGRSSCSRAPGCHRLRASPTTAARAPGADADDLPGVRVRARRPSSATGPAATSAGAGCGAPSPTPATTRWPGSTPSC